MTIPEYLSIYAALLSTIVAYWNFNRSHSKLKIIIVWGIDGIVASIQNPSPHIVHLTAISLVYPFRKKSIKSYLKQILKFKLFSFKSEWIHSSLSNYGIESGCPISIESGKSHIVKIPDTTLKSIRKDAIEGKIRLVAQDALWRDTYSSVFYYED